MLPGWIQLRQLSLDIKLLARLTRPWWSMMWMAELYSRLEHVWPNQRSHGRADAAKVMTNDAEDFLVAQGVDETDEIAQHTLT